MNNKLLIDSLLELDDSGMPKAPTLRQLIDKDVRELYTRDKSTDKKKYVAECIVIYYLGDPKSPARQSGLSDPEALKMAIEQAGLDKSYIPDSLVLHLIKRYYNENITEVGRVVENILQGIHNTSLLITNINNVLNEKLKSSPTLDEIATITSLMKSVREQAENLDGTIKKLNAAKESLLYEKEVESARGGNKILSSMDADSYEN